MKEIIIMGAKIALGIMIAIMIVGVGFFSGGGDSDDGSLRSAISKVFKEQVEEQSNTYP